MEHADECKTSRASWGENHPPAARSLIVDTVHPTLLVPPTITEKTERLGYSFVIVPLSWWIANLVGAVNAKKEQRSRKVVSEFNVTDSFLWCLVANFCIHDSESNREDRDAAIMAGTRADTRPRLRRHSM